MKKNSKITSSLKSKEVVNKALSNSNEDQLDLYNAIFGGRPANNCPVVAVSAKSSRASAYDKIDTFLQAAPMDPRSPLDASSNSPVG